MTYSKGTNGHISAMYRLVTGSRLLRMDLVNASTTFVPTLKKRTVSSPARLDTLSTPDVGLPVPLPWVVQNATAMALAAKNPMYSSSFDAVHIVGLVDYQPYTCGFLLPEGTSCNRRTRS